MAFFIQYCSGHKIKFVPHHVKSAEKSKRVTFITITKKLFYKTLLKITQ